MTQLILFRYADLTAGPPSDLSSIFTNYLFPVDHEVIKMSRDIASYSGWFGSENENLFHNNFQNDNIYSSFETKKDLLELARDNNVVEIIEKYHYC